jgi:hypothetical protein
MPWQALDMRPPSARFFFLFLFRLIFLPQTAAKREPEGSFTARQEPGGIGIAADRRAS